jgi:DNA invertase Pin-like site-specific DNA recombinase
LSSLAKAEAAKVSERTKAGLERARRKGSKIGRPKLNEDLRAQIARRMGEGETPFAVARVLGVDRKTVLKYALHRSQADPSGAEATLAAGGTETSRSTHTLAKRGTHVHRTYQSS